MEMYAVYFGDQLGWYRALHERGRLTSTELADATGTAERYAREWLEHQAASGYLTVDDAAAAPQDRRFRLPATHAEVLLDDDSLAHLAPLARMVAASGLHLDDIVEAYRTGAGVSWQRLGRNAREGQSAINRPLFLHALAQQVLPGVAGLDARLRSGARVADVGCGEGWSSIGIATGYPEVTVDGYDVDAASVDAARRHALGSDAAGRVTFTLQDVAAQRLGDGTPYDAVFAFECVHDLSDPVGFLRTVRGTVADDGFVVVMDELTEERFTAPAGPWERVLYGFSVTTCLVDGMAHEVSAGTGTVMRPETLRRYALEAGFSEIEILPSPAEINFRFYRLHV
ncbi:class I SAM-dependent methyltransferase [Paractinoplanes hotanensis]|uniref:Class I SAM-dependent methyltransferase n=1 Tax=Paractinoplanes hotanensis TaxID=2906497 RepID=A0ABT0Y795_9ACTN|nr:class I SAM-dependent methyltransferase [Actinoplanes hotanensis]MCM4081184.1 class I SAM-dependent methyltransferase [Actinoplanes hotanensis]